MLMLNIYIKTSTVLYIKTAKKNKKNQECVQIYGEDIFTVSASFGISYVHSEQFIDHKCL